MAMTKVEMANHHASYQALLLQARSACAARLYHEAVDLAVASWEHVDGLMQYAQKHEQRETIDIETADIALAYAPLLFDARILDVFGLLLKDCRRIERGASKDLGAALPRCVWHKNHRILWRPA